MAVALLIGPLTPARADNVHSVVASGSSTTFNAGGSATINYKIGATGGDAGDTTGPGGNTCNPSNGTSAAMTISTPAGITASPSSLTFTQCNVDQSVVFSSSTPGTYNITVSVVDADGSSYGTNSGKVTLTVNPGDTSGPVLTPVISGTAGTNGWYTSDVSVAWTVSDPESAVVIDSGCGTQPFTAETTGTLSSCTAHSAGGSSSLSVPIKIDKTGPAASLAASGTEGTNGWYIDDVTVDTNGTDEISGPVTCMADQTFGAETAGQAVNGSCTNDAGLSTDAAPITIKIDKTGPSALLSPTGTMGDNGWYTSNVNVAVSGSDSISEPVTCFGAQTLSLETKGTDVNGYCTNDAGLSTDAASINIKIDKTSPTASLGATGTLGNNGWYTSTVVVSTTGADTISDPVVCTADQTFPNDTTGQTVNGSCQNNAGLTQAAEPISIMIDQSAPTNVVLSVTSGTAGTNGWYTSDVVVHASGEDGTSGVTCTADTTVSSEGTTEVTGSCTNGAGLTTHATSLFIKIDKTGPSAVLTPSGTAGTNGWYTSDVSVTTTGSDEVSEPVVCSLVQNFSDETAGTTVTGSCTNDAGIKTDAAPLTLKIDKTAPTGVSMAASGTAGIEGWYRSDVDVTTTGTETISTPLDCTGIQTVTAEGSTPVNGSCTNDAGLSTAADELTVKIDRGLPTVTLVGGPVDGGVYYLGYNVPAAPTCLIEDGLSGPVGCQVHGWSTAAGAHTVYADGTDKAGNVGTSASVSYTIANLGLRGFYQPVDMGSTQNTVKAGSTVPLKFEVFAGSTELTDIAIKDTFKVSSGNCLSTSAVDDIENYSTGATSFRYDTTGGQFIQNWQVPKGAGVCYTVTFVADGGQSITAYFRSK